MMMLNKPLFLSLLPYIFPWAHTRLIRLLVTTDLKERYRLSVLGNLWFLALPLLTLLIYTLVFHGIFQLRWPNSSESSGWGFALHLWAGLSLFQWVSEILNKAPQIITSQSYLVKKISFPLPILAWVALLGSLAPWIISYLILIVGHYFLTQHFHWMQLTAPLILIPMAMLLLGLIWFLSALGVYIRDTSTAVGLGLSLLLFLCPIFYPISALPTRWQALMYLNPLAYWIETWRNLFFMGAWPNIFYYCAQVSLAFLIMILGALFFKRVEKGFADVL